MCSLSVYHPNTSLRICSKLNFVRPLLNMSAFFCFVLIFKTSISLSLIRGLDQWYFIPTCLVQGVVMVLCYYLDCQYQHYPPMLCRLGTYQTSHIPFCYSFQVKDDALIQFLASPEIKQYIPLQAWT